MAIQLPLGTDPANLRKKEIELQSCNPEMSNQTTYRWDSPRHWVLCDNNDDSSRPSACRCLIYGLDQRNKDVKIERGQSTPLPNICCDSLHLLILTHVVHEILSLLRPFMSQKTPQLNSNKSLACCTCQFPQTSQSSLSLLSGNCRIPGWVDGFERWQDKRWYLSETDTNFSISFLASLRFELSREVCFKITAWGLPLTGRFLGYFFEKLDLSRFLEAGHHFVKRFWQFLFRQE